MFVPVEQDWDAIESLCQAIDLADPRDVIAALDSAEADDPFAHWLDRRISRRGERFLHKADAAVEFKKLSPLEWECWGRFIDALLGQMQGEKESQSRVTEFLVGHNFDTFTALMGIEVHEPTPGMERIHRYAVALLSEEQDALPGRCRCGEMLGLTASGKPSRRKQCLKCERRQTNAAYYAKKKATDPDYYPEVWRQNKRDLRKRKAIGGE